MHLFGGDEFPDQWPAGAGKHPDVRAAGEFDAYASCNRTCELGLTRATGHPYQHVLELLDWASAP